jgi:SagB-type dehydrogenase family enzyme
MIMKSTAHVLNACLLCLSLGVASPCQAQDAKPIALPPPQTTGGKPFMQVLQERKSVREFSEAPLDRQILANLLWAACGTNRPDGHRTVPSAMNSQEIEVYVLTADGAYRYDHKAHQLVPVKTGDLRAKVSGQAYVKQAPVALAYVADYARLVKPKPEEKDFYAAVDTGYVSQNVYLYCASTDLATVVYAVGGKNQAETADALGLRPGQKVILAQSVGKPKPAGKAQ